MLLVLDVEVPRLVRDHAQWHGRVDDPEPAVLVSSDAGLEAVLEDLEAAPSADQRRLMAGSANACHTSSMDVR